MKDGRITCKKSIAVFNVNKQNNTYLADFKQSLALQYYHYFGKIILSYLLKNQSDDKRQRQRW